MKAGAYKINVARTLSRLTDLSADEAAELIENAPAVILSSVPKDAALRVKGALESEGASVVLQSPTINARAAFDVIMTSGGMYKVNVARALRSITKLDEEEVAELLSNLPATILSGVAKDVAEAARQTLKAQGALVKVCPQQSR